MRNIGNLLSKLGAEGHRRRELHTITLADARRAAGTTEVVKVRGRTIPAAQGTLRAPFTARVVLAWHAQYAASSLARATDGLPLRGPLGDESRVEWVAELDERAAVPFWIDDGTGVALVWLEGSEVTTPLGPVVISDNYFCRPTTTTSAGRSPS